jgi:hypothetical protein
MEDNTEARLESLMNNDGEIVEEDESPPEPARRAADAAEDDEDAADDEPAAGDDEPAAGDDEPAAGDDEPAAGDEDAEPANEDDDAAGDDEKAELEKTYPVRINGKEERVTLAEALAGYSRTKDYTQKTSAVARQREEVLQERQFYADNLARLQQAIVAQLPQEPDWDVLAKTDPIEYNIQHAQWTRTQERLAAIQREQERIQRANVQEQQSRLEEYVASEWNKLLDAVPEWKDSKRYSDDMAKLRDYGRAVGFTEDELDQAYDSRLVTALNKARMWDELQTRKREVGKNPPPRRAPRAAGPGHVAPNNERSNRRKQLDAQRARLRKTGSDEDAVRTLELILSD